MNEHYPRIRFYKDGTDTPLVAVRESVSITFYMKRSHQDVVREVLKALEVYRRAVKPQALAWYADPYSDTADWDTLNDKGWAYVHELLKEPAMGVWLAESPSDTTGFEFIYDGRLLDISAETCTSAVSFMLPTEVLEEHGPGWVWELARGLARELPFDSGHAGLCFNYPESVLGPTRAIRPLVFRYPGLNIPALHHDSYCLGTRVNGVHWMNFLGPPVLDALGGPEALRARLHTPATTVWELEGGRAVVTLGTWPEAGDLERGDTLPAYRELARVLEPWLYLGRGAESGFSDEDMLRWERRFLD